jgi:hypothetical protein
MVFRLLFRPSGVWEFQKGAIYDDEKNAIAACIKALNIEISPFSSLLASLLSLLPL